jgi:dTMP kinase
MNTGKFIVIEGGDGCGKSSVIRFLKEKLPSEKFLYTREPGGNITAEKIREVILDPTSKTADPHTMFLLFWAARVEHISNVITPAIVQGINVVSDRLDTSTFGYQIYGEKRRELEKLFEQLRGRYLGGFWIHYIFLDVDPLEGRRRALVSRGIDSNHFDERQVEYYQRVKEGYQVFREQFVPLMHTVVDANQALDQVCKEVISKISLLTGVCP